MTENTCPVCDKPNDKKSHYALCGNCFEGDYISDVNTLIDRIRFLIAENKRLKCCVDK